MPENLHLPATCVLVAELDPDCTGRTVWHTFWLTGRCGVNHQNIIDCWTDRTFFMAAGEYSPTGIPYSLRLLSCTRGALSTRYSSLTPLERDGTVEALMFDAIVSRMSPGTSRHAKTPR